MYEYAPADHQYGSPAVDGMAADKFHVGRRKEIEHHCGRNIPKGELGSEPEIPIDGDVANEVYYAGRMVTVEGIVGNVIGTSHHKPCWIDAPQAPTEKSSDIGMSGPREPEAYAAKKEKHVYPDIAHAAQSIESVTAGQGHVEKYDEEHGQSHEFTAVA